MTKRTWTKKIRPIKIEGGDAFILLSDGSLAIIDAQDVPLVSDWNWTGEKSQGGVVYPGRRKSGRRLPLANAVLPHVATRIDHIDRNPLNCRKRNLRPATNQQNCQNRSKGSANTSGYKGVSWRSDRGKWLATIRRQKLGIFATAEEAARVYDAKARELFGEFAACNFPNEEEIAP